MNETKMDIIVVKCSRRYLFLEMVYIDMVQAEGNYVRLFYRNESYLVREKLSEIENRLQNPCFVRVSRSVIVNIRAIRELQHRRPFNIELTLHNNQRCVMTRNYRCNLAAILGRERVIGQSCSQRAASG